MTAPTTAAVHATAKPAAATATAPGRGASQAGSAAPADAFAALLQSLGAPEGAESLSPLQADTASADAEGPQALPVAAADASADPAAAAPLPHAASPDAPPALPAMLLAMVGQGEARAASSVHAGKDPSPAAVLQAAAGADKPGTASRAHVTDKQPPIAAAADPQPASAGPAAPKPDFAALMAGAAAPARETHEPAPVRAPELPAVAAQPAAAPAMAAAAPGEPTVPVHQAAIASHPLDAAFAGDIAAEVKLMADGGMQQAELHLNPAELGPLRIHLTLSAQTADLSFTAAHATTREGITQALPELRELLAGQGLQLGQAGVGSGGTGQQTDAAWQAAREARAQPGRGAGVAGVAGAAQPATVLVRRGRGMLDLYA